MTGRINEEHAVAMLPSILLHMYYKYFVSCIFDSRAIMYIRAGALLCTYARARARYYVYTRRARYYVYTRWRAIMNIYIYIYICSGTLLCIYARARHYVCTRGRAYIIYTRACGRAYIIYTAGARI